MSSHSIVLPNSHAILSRISAPTTGHTGQILCCTAFATLPFLRAVLRDAVLTSEARCGSTTSCAGLLGILRQTLGPRCGNVVSGGLPPTFLAS